MSIKDKLPLLNSKNAGIRIVGYTSYGFLGLVLFLGILASVSPQREETTNVTDVPEEKCIGESAFSIETEDVLMQTGYFKSVYANIFERDGHQTLEMEVTPSAQGYNDPENFKALLYSVVERAPVCLGIENVKITLILTDYNEVLRYPFSAALNHTEDLEGTSTIEQK